MNKFLLLVVVSFVNPLFSTPLKIQITNIKSQKGSLMIALFDRSTKGNFPNGEKATFRLIKKVTNSTMIIEFRKNSSNKVAIAVFQDLNYDKELNMSWFPIPAPKEPVGFSNNYVPKYGPPKYKGAEVSVPPNVIKIKLRRLD